jgi:hypothetical protein
VAYLPATRGDFIWDDDAYVQNNETLRSGDGLRRIWLEIGATDQYYPLVHTTFWLEYRVWQLSPAGYRGVNILLHVVSVVLLWRLLRRLSVPGAWVAAALFGLHPVHVESVAWITERKNVLSGVFYLAAAFLYLRSALPTGDRPGDRPPRRGVAGEGAGGGVPRPVYVASLLLFACALLSKTVTASLPAALLLVLWWKRGRIGWGDARSLLPFFALGVALGSITIWMERHEVGAVGPEWDLSPVERLLIAGRALWFTPSPSSIPAGRSTSGTEPPTSFPRRRWRSSSSSEPFAVGWAADR